MTRPLGVADNHFRHVSGPAWGGRATRAEVNLDAIRANTAALAALVEPALLMTVVKGNAYGHGAVEVARAALEAGATWLGVYTPSEGAELRAAGIEAPILVFGPFQPPELALMIARRLTPTVAGLEAALLLAQAAGDRCVEIHVKVDTGLTRAGLLPEEAIHLLHDIRGLPSLHLGGLYTHFARADEEDKTPTLRQLEVFAAVAARAVDLLAYRPLLHAANTAGALSVPLGRLDMVRAGIGTYGYDPCGSRGARPALTPALSLISTVSRLSHIASGTGVGYGHDFVASRDTAIALVPLGYGDGLPRSLGHGRGRVLIRGRAAPIVGRLSMDQITVDASDIADVTVGDEVVLIGSQAAAAQTADDLAAQAGTISYDILTGLLPRVPRLYCAGGQLQVPDLESAGG
jgi:alanine racemase